MLLARKGWLAGLLCTAVLTGCASSDSEEEVIKPLPELTNPISAKVLWQERVGDGIGEYFSSLSPAVKYDKLFVAERFGMVTAFNQSSGEELWSSNLRRVFAEGTLKKNNGARLAGGVAVGFDKVFVGSENGVLFALSADDGTVQWQADTAGEVLSDPTIVGTMVLVNTGAGKVQAFDVESGDFQWQMDMTMPSLVLRGTSGIAQSQGAAFFGTPDGKVSALFGESGAPIWEARIAEATGSSELERVVDVDAKPVIVGSNLYAVAFNGSLASIELRSGRVTWNRKYSSYSPIAIQGFTLFLSDADGSIYAIDRRNGLEKWANTDLQGRKLTAPQVVGNYVVAGDYEGYLHIFNRADGSLVGRTAIDSSGLYSQPLKDGDTLYLQTRDGRVAAVTIP
ncbi:outer membrane protein assembly factor BamB [uncultured Ferrimonas sp.]|uniref:outer membrane protein assembly factor BamB n=1 Tax=uncultured Ferrimonas sp. TaxID=432640 RepID=UPI00262373D8|nr:outer membrane protein assembly factor BamB [uncultured Ferrimonas sp.]